MYLLTASLRGGILAAALVALLVTGAPREAPAFASHAGGMDAMSIDMDPSAAPANTATTLGTREACARIDENNVLDADEDVVDGLGIDVTAGGVPPYDNNGTPGDSLDDSGGIIGYQFVLNYSSANLTVSSEVVDNPAINMMAANPNPLVFNGSDPVPDDNTDDKWTGTALDNSFPPDPPEDGDGVLHRITLVSEAVAASGLYPLTLTNNVHIDASTAAFAPDTTNNDSYVAIDQPCPPPADVKLNSQTVSIPTPIMAGEPVNLVVNKQVHNNGPNTPASVVITKTITLPAGCTVNGLGPGGLQIVTGSLNGVGVSVSTPYQEIDTIRCTLAGDQTIQVENCVSPPLGSSDPNPANNCLTNMASFKVDDGDGILHAVETPCGSDPQNPASTPERLNGVDDDGDGVIDEALPGSSVTVDCDGDGYVGNSENHVYSYLSQTNGDQKTCQEYDATFPNPAPHIRPSLRWPADIASSTFSLNKINIQDLSSLVGPIRYLNTDVGTHANDVRMDLAPGSTVGADINIADMATMTTAATGNPPMFNGDRAFNGPTCRDRMYNKLVAGPEQPPVLNAACHPFSGLLGWSDDHLCLNAGQAAVGSVDLSIPGRGLDWNFARSYRSDIVLGGPLGYAWDFNYNRRLQQMPSGNMLLADGSGRADIYRRNLDGSYTAPAGYYSRLVKNVNNTFTERYSDGSVLQYATVSAGFARLTSMADRNGNALTFSYDADGRLTTARDTLGRNTTYAYNAEGRLSSVTDFTGRAVTFTYDASGNLETVTSPAVTGTPNGNDFPAGKTTRYGYYGTEVGPGKPALYHNLKTVKAPEEEAFSGPPRIFILYGETPAALEFDRVTQATVGGTNASGVPAGGTSTYAYAIINPNPPNPNLATYSRTTVTDANGNLIEYDINRQGNAVAVRPFSNRNIRASDPASWTTTYQYDAESRLVRVDRPEGKFSTYTYDSANADRLLQGNLLSVEHNADSDRGGDQAYVRTSFTYDPIYNRVRMITEPRGNDPSYAPQNGGVQSAARYTSTATFDYEESCDATAVAANVGRTASEVASLWAAVGMCAVAAGDVNGDGITSQVRGNAVRETEPPVLLLDTFDVANFEREFLPDCNDASDSDSDSEVNDGCPADGPPETGAQCDNPTDDDADTKVNDGCPAAQLIRRTAAYNLFGQPISVKDPESNVHTFEYYPERDPNGDGTIDCSTCNLTTGGYLKQANIDTASDALRNSGTNPPPTNIRNRYEYDARGNRIRDTDGRGVRTDFSVNQLDQVVQVSRAAAVNVFAPDPPEPIALSAEAFLSRYWYDHNDRLVLAQTEDRGNTSGTDGNLPSGDLPSVAPNPDPPGGPAFQDTVVKYDVLDNPLDQVDEVFAGLPPVNRALRLRYDRNSNLALIRSPVANLPAGPDQQLANVVSYVYDERDLVATSTRGGTTAQWQALAANDDIPGGSSIPNSAGVSAVSYGYNLNGALSLYTDAQDTDGAGGPESWAYMYDGLDRLVSEVDPAGGQSFYQYDPAGNRVSARAYGPAGGPTPTSNGAATFAQPLTPSSFTQQQLARSDAKYDERSRAFETNGHLYACNGSTAVCTGINYVRPPVITDGPLGGTNDGLVVYRTAHDREDRPVNFLEDSIMSTFAELRYDGADRALMLIEPPIDSVVPKVEYAYDDNSNPIENRETDIPSIPGPPNEMYLDTMFYDALNRRTQAVNNAGETMRYAYDSRDNLVSWSDAKGPLVGSITRRAFPNGALTVNNINDPGNTGSFMYDGLSRRVVNVSDLRTGGLGGNPIDTSNPSNPDGKVVIESFFDVNGRPFASADDGSVPGDNNDSIGVLEPVNPKGNVTRTTYDDLNRPVAVTYDDGTTGVYQYDRDNNVTQVTNQNGSVFVYTYDGLNRPVSITATPGPGVVNRSTVQTSQFDGLRRLTRATDNNDPADISDDSTVEHAYDSLGQLLEERQQMGASPPSVVSSQYSGDGNRTSLIYPDDRQYTYGYDAVDRLRNVQRQPIFPEPPEPPTATYSYIGGRLLERTYGSGVRLTYLDPNTGQQDGYDGARRTVRTRHLRPDNSAVAEFVHTYDRMSNLVAEQRLHSNMQDTYSYDSVYRETAFTRDAQITPAGLPASTENYLLDGIGDWDSHATDNNMGEYDVFDGNPRMYDDNGNLLMTGTMPASQQFSYDPWDRLVNVSTGGGATQIADYRYDPFGRRVQKMVTNSGPLDDTLSYSYDGGEQIQEAGVSSGQKQYAGAGQDLTDLFNAAAAGFTLKPVEDQKLYETYYNAVVGLRRERPLRIDITPPSQPAQPPLFYHGDGKGNVAATTDVGVQVVTRTTYTDYGVPRFEDANSVPIPGAQADPRGNPFQFAGMHWEPEAQLYASVPGEAITELGFEIKTTPQAATFYKPDEGRSLAPGFVFKGLDAWGGRASRSIPGAGDYAYAGGNPASGATASPYMGLDITNYFFLKVDPPPPTIPVSNWNSIVISSGGNYRIPAAGGNPARAPDLKPSRLIWPGPEPGSLKWDFRTRCIGCGNPWLGDIAAASSFTSSSKYKLYSVTGQPTPVGEATSSKFTLKSGFIYSSQTQVQPQPVPPMVVPLNGFDFNIEGVGLEALFFESVQSILEEAIAEQVRQKIPPYIQKFLNHISSPRDFDLSASGLTLWNGSSPRLNTFGIAAYGEFERFMRDVASTSGGRYYSVP